MAVWDISKTLGITGLHTEKRDVRNKVEAVESALGRCFMPCFIPLKSGNQR